jgi:alginate O-acetyltransferase complex protein AlgI
MVFSSNAFIFGFMPLALIGFLITTHIGRRSAALWLVLISLGFYAYWRVEFLPLLLISIAFNFGIGQMLHRNEDRPRFRTVVLLCGVGVDLLALIFFKYTTAMAASLGFRTLGGLPFDDIILPLGISFFTFTQIGYLVDVKQGVARTRDLMSYVMFVTFFPHLIAGPILHNREMMPQFADSATYRFNVNNFAIGLTIFIIGLAKKVLLADPLSADVAENFGHANTAGCISAWYAVVAYSFQLYFDFSGYSDMAIGLARMFNIRFPLNFNSPYKATTVIDYWQRFHMTLTRFITMYIFSPLALSITRLRASKGLDNSRRAATSPGGFASLVAGPTLITMGLAGVWHGAGTQYLIFGLLHGFYITMNHATRVFFPKPAKAQRPWLRAANHVWKVLAVYVAALVGFAFFRASSTASAFSLLAGMIGKHGVGGHLPVIKLVRLAYMFALVWAAPNTQQIMSKYEPALGRPIANPYAWLTWKPGYGWAVYSATLGGLSILALGGAATEFLYFQF